jgi:uncharacterized spore protein YtfJ
LVVVVEEVEAMVDVATVVAEDVEVEVSHFNPPSNPRSIN